MTRTYVHLEVSESTYNDIAAKLKDAGYDHAFHSHDETPCVDMHGIALVKEPVLPLREKESFRDKRERLRKKSYLSLLAQGKVD